MNELATFKESLYPPLMRYLSDYKKIVRNGYAKAAGSSVVICGLCRNISGVIDHTIARMESTGGMFSKYTVVVYENDSTDGTTERLTKWASENPNVVLLTEKLGMPINPSTRCLDRAGRMARFRNEYREYVANNLSDYDYTIVVDMDLNGGWSYDGIANSIGHENWDFMGSNGLLYIKKKAVSKTVQYDAWAFRHFGHPEPEYGGDINKLVFGRGQPLLPVYSCFGGMGIYRTKAMVESVYAGGDCEHVPFHLRMRQIGMDKLFLNPSQITLYGTRG